MDENSITKFRKYCLSNEGWEQCLKDEAQIEYCQMTESSNVISLKVISNDFKDFTPKEIFETIIDSEFRKEWDPYLINWSIIDNKNEHTNVIRMLFKMPVITNRAFVFDCETCCMGEGENEEWFIRFESVDSDKYEIPSGYVRGAMGLSGFMIRKENSQTVVYCIGNSDIGGSVPKWIVNSMAKSTVPTMLKGLREKLPQYKERKRVHPENK